MRAGTIPMAATILITAGCLTAASADGEKPTRVTVDNFRRAESNTYFARFVKEGGFGRFKHERELAAIDNQTVIRLNRDTLYSFGVFDLDAAPVTVTLPDVGKRFMAMQVIDEDQYAPAVFYAPVAHTLTKSARLPVGAATPRMPPSTRAPSRSRTTARRCTG